MQVITDFQQVANFKATISVIMPAWNAEQTIHKAISSIIAQSFGDFILVIVDDASTDNTWQVISEFDDDRIVALRLANNQGHLKIRNQVFNHSQTPFLTFQDADDWSHPQRLAKLHEAMANDAELALCGSWCINVFDKRQKVKSYPVSHEDILNNLAKGATNNYCSASAMFRREVLSSIGDYDAMYHHIGSADIDWQTRVTEQFQTANLPEPLYYYRQHSESFSKRRRHPLSHLSADIAYFCHLLRTNDIAYQSDDILAFIREQLGTSSRAMRDSLWQKKLLVRLYQHSPEGLRNHLVARRRRRLTASWLANFPRD